MDIFEEAGKETIRRVYEQAISLATNQRATFPSRIRGEFLAIAERCCRELGCNEPYGSVHEHA